MTTNSDVPAYETIQAQPALGERGWIDLFKPAAAAAANPPDRSSVAQADARSTENFLKNTGAPQPSENGATGGSGEASRGISGGISGGTSGEASGGTSGGASGGGLPFVLLVHGGGWARGDRTSFHWVAQHMVNHGFAAITCSYRLTDVAAFPACYDDLVNLLRWLKQHAAGLGLSPDHCGVLGSSAGGHLVSLLMTRCQSDPAAGDIIPLKAGVVYCPPLDMQTQYDHDLSRGASMTRDLLGGSPDEQPQRAHDATIFNWIDKPGFTPVPLWIAHGDADMTVPIDDTYELVDQWQKRGGEVTFHVEKDAGHTMVHPGTGPRYLLEQDKVMAFLKKHLQ